MRNNTSAIVIGCLIGLASCATPPLRHFAPKNANSGYHLGPSPLLADPDYMHRFLNDQHSVLYMQNHGGGGVAVGVLLGPLGVIANIKMIQAQTESDATLLKNKLPVDVASVVTSSLAAFPALNASNSNDSMLLSPYLYVENIDDSHIRFAALLIASSNASAKTWTRQYFYVIPDVYAKAKIASDLTAEQIGTLKQRLGEGFNWDIATFVQDKNGSFNPQVKGVIHSDFVTPRIQIPLAGYRFDAGAGRLGFVTTNDLVYSLPSDTATITN